MDKLFYTKEELQEAQSKDIIDYLLYMGYELKRESGAYRGVLHDSLYIKDNGEWHWNSRDLHGNKPVRLLEQILIEDYGYSDKDAFIHAVKKLAGTEDRSDQNNNYSVATQKRSPTETEPSELGNITLPERNGNMNRVIAYLCNARGIDYEFVKEMIVNKKLYETKKFHNACFVSHDESGIPRHAYLRSTISNEVKRFAQDVPNSDKSYGLILSGKPESKKVYLFENYIDGLSHATLYKLYGLGAKDGHRLTAHGTSFRSLDKFLSSNPQIEEIVSCMDNDETGKRRSKKMCEEYSQKGYRTFVQLPKEKDFNQSLLKFHTDNMNLEMDVELEV